MVKKAGGESVIWENHGVHCILLRQKRLGSFFFFGRGDFKFPFSLLQYILRQNEHDHSAHTLLEEGVNYHMALQVILYWENMMFGNASVA